MTIIMRTAAVVRKTATHMATIGVITMTEREMRMMNLEEDMASQEEDRAVQLELLVYKTMQMTVW